MEQIINGKMIKGELKDKQSLIEKATIENLIYLGGVTMNDIYYARQVGVQGNKAGNHANIQQNFNNNDWNGINIEDMIKELDMIKKYIKKSFDDDQYDIIIGNVSSATVELKSDNTEEAGNLLKKCGPHLYDIAKSIGCAVVARYLGNFFGM